MPYAHTRLHTHTRTHIHRHNTSAKTAYKYVDANSVYFDFFNTRAAQMFNAEGFDSMWKIFRSGTAGPSSQQPY